MENMNGRKYLLIFFVFVMVMAHAVIAESIVTSASLKPTLAKYEPYPAEARYYVKIFIKVENVGNAKAENASFELIPRYPLYFDGSDKSFREYGIINGKDDIVLEYKLGVNKDAVKGDAEMTLRYKTSSINLWLEKDFNISVNKNPTNPELVPMFVSLTPSAYPGSESTLNVDIANVAPGTAYYLIVEAETEAAEILKKQVFIGTLEPNDFDSVEFLLKIKEIYPGIYPVKLTMKYKDKDYDEKISYGTVDIVIIDKAIALQSLKQETPIWIYLVYIVIILLIIRYLIWPWIKKTHSFVRNRKLGK